MARWSTVRRGSWSSGALRVPQHLDVGVQPFRLRGQGVRVSGEPRLPEPGRVRVSADGAGLARFRTRTGTAP
jgi:hypothetical protein